MKTLAASLLAALALPLAAHAAIFQTFSASFNSYDLFTRLPITTQQHLDDATDFSNRIGNATLRHTGDFLPDGSYALDSLEGLSLSFDFYVNDVEYFFTLSDLATPIESIGVQFQNGTFNFYRILGEGEDINDGTSTAGFRRGDFSFQVTTNSYSHIYVLADVSDLANNNVTAIAYGLYGSSETAYFGTAIPEPASAAALFGLAALGLGVTRRRRA